MEFAAAEVIGVPERERQIIADWYACTWVDVRGCELKAETRRGVVLGNPMADLFFNENGAGPVGDPPLQRGVG